MALPQIWVRLWTRANSVSIRFKIMGIVLFLTLLLGLVVTFQMHDFLKDTLTADLEQNGIAVARYFAARSTDLVLTGNTFDLHNLIQSIVVNNPDVRYAFVAMSNGAVLSHSFRDGFPVGLAVANTAEPDSPYRVKVLDTNEGIIRDVAVPIQGGNAGIARVGISEQSLNEALNSTTNRLLLYTGFVAIMGIVIAYFLTSVLIRPIRQLVEATQAIARGDLDRQAPIDARDEIGELGAAFNVMSASLLKSRQRSEAFQMEMVSRNRSLLALNAIAMEVNGNQSLERILETLLVKALEGTGLGTGWVKLFPSDGRQDILVCHRGLSGEAVKRIQDGRAADCACGLAIRDRTSVVVQSGRSDCPVLEHLSDDSGSGACHVAVPIVSKSDVVGILGVAKPGELGFTAEELRLLTSISYHVGTVCENGRLWQEIKHREELLARLLKNTISAQEAERQRIARELHDQTGQSITALKVGLETLQSEASGPMRPAMGRLMSLASQTLDEVRELALQLRPSSLDDLGLIAVVDDYTRTYSERHRIKCHFQTIGFDGRRLSPETEITIYRIIQEAMTNVARYSGARTLSVLLEVRDNSVISIVEDDGKGFDVTSLSLTGVNAHNLGLHGMQERAALIGGTLTVESTPGVGTTVYIEVPLKWEDR